MNVKSGSKLAVVGAGNMGSGIAQKMATEGFDVVLVDLGAEQVARGLAGIRATLAQGVERRLFAAAEAEAIAGRIRGTTDWNDLADRDLVVEAVFEDLAVKREVFARLEQACRADAVLASNTSSFSVSELARSAKRPERVLGLHYFYHPAKNRLVEVIPGERTDPAVVARAWALQEQLGKTPIASADAHGFIVNRFFVPWLNEAVRLLEEGLAGTATIESAAKGTFGVGMGPFELMNVTGVPIALHAATTLGRELGPFYAPAKRLAEQVEAGKPWSLEGEDDPAAHDLVADRLRAVAFYVAAALVDERVGTMEDTDIGARVGLRWPAGPFEMMNAAGVKRALALVTGLASRWDLGLPQTLSRQAAKDEPFAFELVRREVREGIAWITVNRPDAMNALNETIVAQLHDAVRRAIADPAVRGLVIGGSGKAFIAGADIRFFVRHMKSGELDRLQSFTEAGHALLDEIDRSPKPVVARVQGLALGGGLELALACDLIVASTKATVAFPETGIGIYPGLGGTQRTPRKIGTGLAKWMIYTGQMVSAEQAAAIGLADRVVAPADLDRACREAIDEAVRGAERKTLPADLAALERFFATVRVEDLLAGRTDTAGDASLAKVAQRVATKAPVALRIAESLLDLPRERPLSEGLRAELGHLREIFTTEDAMTGLSSLGRGRPEFRGR